MLTHKDQIKLGSTDEKGFYLERNGFDPFRCEYEATYGRGWQNKKIRYPNGAIRVYLTTHRSFQADSLDQAKELLAYHLTKELES